MKRMKRLAARRLKSFRRQPNPERLHELKLPSIERHFLCSSPTTGYKLFHGYLNLSAKEFVKTPAAGNLRQHNFHVCQSCLQFCQTENCFCCTFGWTVKWTASTHRWSSDSAQFHGSLGCQLVLHFPWLCSTLPISLFLCKWFCPARAIFFTS